MLFRSIFAVSFCLIANPVDSSIVTCADKTRLIPRFCKIGAIRNPYKAFLVPSNADVAIALIALPPEPITPTAANCDAPEKVNSENKQACQTEKPAATAAAPKAAP